ncbi:MAG: imidazole glycerol phosphate synthase subunit HisH [Vicinamibacteria bacterium]|jgi:glutamine amidotransferase|nr:imidazole glycerol phosphate synthase subunit HisH [Vicinamibacteria bacterium]
MIAIVDYGFGNLGSVTKAFTHLGAPCVLSGDHDVLRRASALVLPGDGAFGAAMDELRARKLIPLLDEAVAQAKPLLGICIGMQLLFEESEEHGRHQGLGYLPGRVRRFSDTLVVPHMGWNALTLQRPHPFFEGLGSGDFVYFVHSYYCAADASVVLATADYGADFAAVVGQGSVLGVQFHPEKSQTTGLKMIANFVRMVTAASTRATTLTGAVS